MQAAGVDPRAHRETTATLVATRRITGIQLGPALGRLLLGVVQRPSARTSRGAEPLEVEQDRGGDERPGEAAPAGLVGAGDEAAPSARSNANSLRAVRV